ncbi:MAG TPA: chaperonin GroEL [Candidatus Limnocylindria bacterium]|nr:chaperonin GroEL [Candidatus Limnocylindria bacterium]
MGKQIRFDAAAREALRRGVDQLAGAVRVTLGPRGRNVVIDRREGSPTITNDGLTILREIELENPFENMGAQLVKEVATRTGEVAGDGTTTATVLAHSVVGEGLKAIASGCNPMAIKRGIDRAVVVVVEELRKQSQQVRNRDDVARVATVSANNDSSIGNLIADAIERVGNDGVITIEEGRGMETSLQVVEGIRLDRGYLSPYFVTDPERMEVVLDDALILLTDVKLSGVRDLLPAMEHAARLGRPLVVVGEDVEGEALATLVVNRLRGTIGSVAVRAPWSGDERREMLEDLAVLTGARAYTRERGLALDQFTADDFGRAKRVLVDKDSTTLLEGAGAQSEIRARIAKLRREIERSDTDYDRDRLRVRLGRVTGGVAVVHVGAPTETEMRERKSRVEDALAATRAALEEGVVVGGGVALLRSQPAVSAMQLPGEERVGQEIVARALEEPARQIATNAGEEGAVVVERIRRGKDGFGYNALTGRYEDLVASGIVDATKVTRCALQNAASIGSLVLTTDAIVVDSPDEPEAEPEAPADDA